MFTVVGLLKLETKETTCDLLNCFHIAQYRVEISSIGKGIPNKKSVFLKFVKFCLLPLRLGRARRVAEVCFFST
jgi:hypothetical protein